MHATAFCDGGVRGNPGGPYACAVVIYSEETGIGHQEAVYLGDHGTCNSAEYEGLILALKIARRLQITHLTVRMDSRLVIEQVLGNWRVKEPTLRPYVERARELAARFDEVKISHVPREENAVADALCTNLLDEITGKRRGEPRALQFA